MVIARTGRGLLVAAGLGLLGGCALPSGRTGGDPILGNFNRPIAPTPMPYQGGYGGGSPAQDGGARLGLPAPDVATPPSAMNSTNLSAKMAWSLPAPTAPTNTDYSGNRSDPRKATDKLFTPSYQRVSAVDGAKLMGPEQPALPAAERSVTDYHPIGNTTALRTQAPVNGFIAGASLPGEMQYNALRLTPSPAADSVRMQTVEEGQLILAGYGLKWHNLQQADTGEWQYSCIVNADVGGTTFRRYDSRHPNPVEAVRAVVDQARRDR